MPTTPPDPEATDDFQLGVLIANAGEHLPDNASDQVRAGFDSIVKPTGTPIAPGPVLPLPVVPPEVTTPGPKDARSFFEPKALAPQPTGAPVPIIDIEEAVKPATTKPEKGQWFFFGEVMTHQFPDRTEYQVKKNRAFITDKKLIKNLVKLAEDQPGYKIFPEPTP